MTHPPRRGYPRGGRPALTSITGCWTPTTLPHLTVIHVARMDDAALVDDVSVPGHTIAYVNLALSAAERAEALAAALDDYSANKQRRRPAQLTAVPTPREPGNDPQRAHRYPSRRPC